MVQKSTAGRAAHRRVVSVLVTWLVLAGGAFRVLVDHSPAAAKRLFGTSIVYLFALFALLLVDRAWPVPLLP